MSRRLQKSRTVKLTSTANLPRLEANRLDLHLARTFARKRPSLRASLMVGTAVAAGSLATVMVNTQPASAGVCTANGNTLTCTGNFPGGIGPFTYGGANATGVANIPGPSLIGPNGKKDGITIYSGNVGQTLDITVGDAGAVGIGTAPGYYGITRDGIHVASGNANTTINLNTAATIGTATHPVGRDGIYVDIFTIAAEPLTATINITNSGAINAGGAGILAFAEAIDPVDPTVTVSISNSAPINSVGDSIPATAIAIAGYNGTAKAYAIVNNSGALTSTAGRGIAGFAEGIAFGPGSLAVAGTSLTNTGPINSFGDGISGFSFATTQSFGVNAGLGVATTIISNANTITSTSGRGIYGGAFANSGSYFGAGATAGTALAETIISNSAAGTISSQSTGIFARAGAYADAETFVAGSTGTAGNAGAVALITNHGAITTKTSQSIAGYSRALADVFYAYHAIGGTATAETVISNTATNTSPLGIFAGARTEANATGSFAAGGTATAGTAVGIVLITNTGATTATNGDGIYGFARGVSDAFAYTAKAGTAIADTIISNSAAGTINSKFTGIVGYGRAYADAFGSGAPKGYAKGGTATATTSISNAANITSTLVESIRGTTHAEAEAFGYVAVGGKATANTSIYNSGTLIARDSDIFADARAYASGFGSFAPKGKGTGGTAVATVTVTNKGNLINTYFNGINGIAEAVADGAGYTAKGGSATATSTLYNSGTIISIGTKNTGNAVIDRGASAFARGFGSGSPKGSSTGGTATATVSITNKGALAGGYSESGIYGHTFADANAYGPNTGSRAYTAKGGTATALTSIYNSGPIHSYFESGIVARAAAVADAFGSYAAKGASGRGGTASATVLITNKGPITAPFADGIYGASRAGAVGEGFTGIGGTALATTQIYNSGTIISDAGIFGYAGANASGVGSFAAGPPPGYGKGGTAVALTYITNHGNITSSDGGIVGVSRAIADGSGHVAVGGIAVATTGIYNSGNIRSIGTGISGSAAAYTQAIGSYNILGAGRAGSSSASVGIVNRGNISSTDGRGISGFSLAEARAFAVGGRGGLASARTQISNYGRILTYADGETGIYAGAVARAVGGSATGTGGEANALAQVTNAGTIRLSGDDAAGITALSYANAGGGRYAGYAKAQTIVTNTGTIATPVDDDAPGIVARSHAIAYGYFTASVYKSGVAYAFTTVNNSGGITTLGNHSPGIYAYSDALAGTPTQGFALAETTVTNSGAMLTVSYNSPGIEAHSFAFSGGAAEAVTTVTNTRTGSIRTLGDYSPGIFATSLAAGFGGVGTYAGVAFATTTVNNAGSIRTYGFDSPGIAAASSATGTYVAVANTVVNNSDGIRTFGPVSAGVVATSYARGSYAYTTVNNSGSIVTFGVLSPGVVAASLAVGSAPVAKTIVNNSGLIETTNLGSSAVVMYANAVSLLGPATASNTLNNSVTGEIVADAFPYNAVFARGARTTINNAGYIFGNVDLPAFRNTFNNTGEWVMVGDSHFGGNVLTVLNNIGTATSPTDVTCDLNGCVTMVKLGSTPVPSHDTATAGYIFHTVTLHGLETFNNNGGLVTMIDGQPNDRIVIENGPVNQVFFNGTGNSRLGVDAFLGGPGSTADVLQVGGHTGQGYVTGLTHIVVHDTNAGGGGFNPVGIPVAESGGAAGVTIGGNPANVAGNFDLPQGPIVKGLFQFDLFFLPKGSANDPCANGFNCWFLASTPSTAALQLPRLMTAANDIFRDSSGMWLDRTADLRDYYFFAGTVCGPNGGGADMPVKARPPACVPQPGGAGPGVWFRAFGDWTHNNGTADVNAFGRTISHDVNYHQTTGGAQLGADFAVNGLGYNPILFGVLGGVIDSTVDFNQGGHAHFRGGNAGAYATYLNQGFFFDTLFLAQIMNLDFTNSQFGFSVNGGDVTQIGGHIDTGYRFQFNPWFVEPQATLEIAHSQFDKFNLPAVFATSADLDNNWVAGRLGGRVGGTWFGSGWRWEPSLTGGVWYDFTGHNVATLTSNGFVVDLIDNSTHRTTGEVGGMLNAFQVGGGWSAFVKGDYRFASGFSSGLVTGGFRYQWGTWPIAWGGH